jgi:hypothetical protein
VPPVTCPARDNVPPDPRLTGRIGGLTAWATLPPETMLGPAHRGFRTRFERVVDPDGVLPADERARRADRARRAHMLSLAARSAEVRRTRKAARASDDPRTAQEVSRNGRDEPPTAA